MTRPTITTHEAVLSVASNMPDAHERVLEALSLLHDTFTGVCASDTYRTTAHSGDTATPPYTNVVVIVTTTLDLSELTLMLKRWEDLAGRTPAMRQRHLVPIDYDVVMFDGEVLRPTDFERPYFTIGWHQLQKQSQQSNE